jgi:hypothetical protein
VALASVPLYHRLENSRTQTTQDAKAQESSGEIWGHPARWSSIPCVKAYRNGLPTGSRGLEFTTDVAPTPGSGSPFEAFWYQGTPGVTVNKLGLAVIKGTVTNNTQV